MQWFIEWAAEKGVLPIADWDSIKNMTVGNQEKLAGLDLYSDAYSGPSNDPQTSEEAALLIRRVLGSGLVADKEIGLGGTYQNYLTFVTSAATQLMSGSLHDYYNGRSLYVTSKASKEPYVVWGDDTLLTGADGVNGVSETASAARLSQAALREILATGETGIRVSQIRDLFPTGVGSDRNSVTSIQDWSTGQQKFCNNRFGEFLPALKKLLVGLATPRLGVVSRDQNFASVWSRSLDSSKVSYPGVQVALSAGGRVFAGSNGSVYELDPQSGKIVHSLQLSDSVGVGDYTTRIASDGTNLFAGVHGYVYIVALDTWQLQATASIGGFLNFEQVDVLAAGGRVFAGSNGSVYELAPRSGKIVHSLQLSDSVGVGDYTTRIASDGTNLYAGVHGYAYVVPLDTWKSGRFSAVGGPGNLSVEVLAAGGRVFAGSDGSVYELDPGSGKIVHSLQLSDSVGVGDYTTRIASDGTNLFAGVHGYVYGIDLSDWKQQPWSTGVGGVAQFRTVGVSVTEGRVFAGSNGSAYELSPLSGRVLHELSLTLPAGAGGDYDTVVVSQDWNLYTGVHGYVSKLLVNNSSPDGTLCRNSLMSEGGWRGWTPNFDGAPSGVRSVSMAMGPIGNMEAYAVGFDGILYHNFQTGDGVWHGWTPDPDGAPSGMESVSMAMGPAGSLEIFAVRSDGTLYYNFQTHGGVWNGWVPDPDGAPSGVRSVSMAMGPVKNLETFAVTSDGTLYHNFQTGDRGWHGWTPDFDGAPPCVRSVSMAMGPNGSLEVFAVVSDGILYHNALTGEGGWQGWTPNFDGAPSGVRSVSMAMGPNGNLETFAVGYDGMLYHNFLAGDGSWHGWTPNFDGAPSGMQSVSMAMGPSGNLETFAVGQHGTLHHNFLAGDGSWHGWTPNFDQAPRAQSVVLAMGPTKDLEVFAIAAS